MGLWEKAKELGRLLKNVPNNSRPLPREGAENYLYYYPRYIKFTEQPTTRIHYLL